MTSFFIITQSDVTQFKSSPSVRQNEVGIQRVDELEAQIDDKEAQIDDKTFGENRQFLKSII